MEKYNKNEKIEERNANGLNAFSHIVMPIIKKVLGKKGFVLADMLALWEQIVGEETASYTQPVKVDFKNGEKTNGLLHLAVPSGAFALEVQHKEKFIIEKVNGYFGYMAIVRLKIIQDASFAKRVISKINQPKLKKSLVSLEEQNYINSLATDVADPELRETLVRLGKSVFNENEDR